MNSSQEIQTKIATWISEESGWTINSVHGHWINIVQYNPVKRSSYIKLQSEVMSFKKGLIKSEEDEKHFKQTKDCHICKRS